MNTPSETSFDPSKFEALREQTLKQIEKDFRLQGIEIVIFDEEQTYSELVREMSKQIDDLDLFGSHKLQALLYQLDISEQYVQDVIFAKPKERHSTFLADAIIKRCFAKVIYRKKFS